MNIKNLAFATCVFSFSENTRQNFIYHTLEVNELIKIMPDGLSVDFGIGSSVVIDDQKYIVGDFICYSDHQGDTISFDESIYHGETGKYNISLEFIVKKA
jgi:hypothetical protein